MGRGLRKSSLYDRLAKRGAQFAQIYGWERPRWYELSGAGERYSWQRSNWWEPVREEARAVRERVGLMDLSTFSKYDLRGPDAHAFLERVFANSMAQRDGGIVLAHLLTTAWFIEREITVARLPAQHY